MSDSITFTIHVDARADDRERKDIVPIDESPKKLLMERDAIFVV
jgi:hypothetical protein